MTDLIWRLFEVGQLIVVLTVGTAHLRADRPNLTTKQAWLGFAHLSIAFAFSVGIALNASLRAPLTPGAIVVTVLLVIPTVIFTAATIHDLRGTRDDR